LLSDASSFIAAVVPLQPTSIIANVISTTTIKITFIAPQQNGGSPITDFKLYQEGIFVSATGSASITSFTV